MKNSSLQLVLLLLAGLVCIIASCAHIKTLPGLPATHPEALAVGQQTNCGECHEDQEKGTMKAISGFSHTPAFVKNHRLYATTSDRLCGICHQESFCSTCHTNQVEMKPSTRFGNRPDRELLHRGNFMTMHRIEGKLDPASCYRCHGRGNNERCAACHR